MPDINFDNADTEFEEEGAYDNLLGNKADSGATPAGASKKEGEQKPKPTVEDLVAKVDALAKQNSAQQEQIRQISAEKKTLESNYAKLGEVFNPSQEEQDALSQSEEENAYDNNPTKFIKDVVNGAVGESELQRQQDLIQYNSKKALQEIKSEYVVDWKKPGIPEKIAAMVDTFNPEFRRKHPKEAVERAIILTNTGKRRPKPPHIEGSGLHPQSMKKRALTEAQVYKKNFFKAKIEKKPVAAMYDNFLKS